MELITREEAKRLGLNRYFTGQPCPKGHISPRRTINRACTECAREYAATKYTALAQDPDYTQKARDRAKAWAQKNPDRYRANQRRYQEENRESLAQYRREYSEANRERLRQRDRDRAPSRREANKKRHKKSYQDPEFAQRAKQRAKAWRKNNPERYAEALKRWARNNPERLKVIQRAGHMNRRARKLAAGKLSPADVKAVLARKRCEGCGRIHPHMEIDHIKAISRGGSNHLSNLQLLCRPCNRSKSAKDAIIWAQENGRLL